MVAFTRIPYHECLSREASQSKTLARAGKFIVGTLFAGAALAAAHFYGLGKKLLHNNRERELAGQVAGLTAAALIAARALGF